ncbi:MAG: AAA family ATPase [Alphaproteobacteria bacterium]|nr:AAA family ATPase [Alphaproteobacteria bacterium]
MSMLKSIAIAGFKSFGAEAKVPLRPLNVLIGANGSGKSNFLDAFSFLQAYGRGGVEAHVERSGGADKTLHFGTRHTEVSDIRIEFPGGEHCRLRLHPTVSDKIGTSFGYGTGFTKLDGEKSKTVRDLEDKCRERLASWRQYHFHDTSFHSPMKKTSNLHDNRFLREDGSNLASFLYLLRERHKASYGLIRNTIRQVAPFFDDFALEPLELNPGTILLEWRHRNSDAYFNAASLSDGTLRFMGLAALLLQPAALRPDIVLLDEPELGLHPYAIAILAAMLRSASKETQIVVATQSPGLLDHFEPEDVLTAERVGGETRLNRLDAEPLREWLEDYSLGQLWEKNHFGGRPAREGSDTG